MNRSEQNTVHTICQKFLHESVPEYVKDVAGMILSEGGVQKIEITEGETWSVRGRIQSDDLQIYTASLHFALADSHVTYQCNCQDSFSGICRHVAALALYLDEQWSKVQGCESDAVQTTKDWKRSFRSFFSADAEPEPGHSYLIFRFEPDQDRLLVSFFRARLNKMGLSSVHTEITLEQIILNPEWSEFSPTLPKVARQIGQSVDYYGHRIEIPEGLISLFLWSIRKEFYLFWQDTQHPCHIEHQPFILKLKPQLNEQGFYFDVLLQREGREPFSLQAIKKTEKTPEEHFISFYGQMPLWICFHHKFYPVQTCLDSALLRSLLQDHPVIPQKEIPEFIDRVLTRLPSSALYEPKIFLQNLEQFFQPASYNPKLFLNEEGSLLTLEIDNIYETIHGEFTLNGPNPEFQTGSYTYENTNYLVQRHQEEEALLIKELSEMNFQAKSNKVWFLEPDAAIIFLLDFYPQFVEKYRIYGETALSRYKIRNTASVVTAQVTSKEQWFNLNITVDYDGQTMPLDKIWKAWSSGKRYIQLKDGSYTSLPEAWLEKFAHRLSALGLDPQKVPQSKFESFEAPVLDNLLEELPNANTDAKWLELRDKIRSFRGIKEIRIPNGLQADLRMYQKQGLSYLNFLSEYGFGGILADEMGLGKTVQTLAFIQYMVEQGYKQPNLIVVPTSVLPNWEREAKKFVPHIVCLTIYGTGRESMFKHIAEAQIVITTFSVLRRDLEEMKQHEFNTVILDEAQNIKNPNTITAKSVRSLKARMRLCLSGTPIENNLFELWSLFEFLMPGFLGSQHYFQKNIAKPIKDGDPATLDYLQLRVKPFILRRTKTEVASDLPPKVESVIYCALEEEQTALYASLANKLRTDILNDVDKKGLAKSQISILDALLKLRQICCHPKLLKIDVPGFSNNIPSGKFDAFKNMVTEIVEGGHKVLVFSQFVQMLQIIKRWLDFSQIPLCYLDGSSQDRFEQVDRFNKDPAIPIFLISLKAGGTGLNLTSADYVIHYDPWWNPAVENQATDRTHRIGQTRQVFSYKLICKDTVEEKILKLQESKKNVADAVIPGQETWKSLTRDDLAMLFES